MMHSDLDDKHSVSFTADRVPEVAKGRQVGESFTVPCIWKVKGIYKDSFGLNTVLELQQFVGESEEAVADDNVAQFELDISKGG